MEDSTIKKIYLLFSLACCASCTQEISNRFEPINRASFITVEWCGAATRPPLEFGLTTESTLADGTQWCVSAQSGRKISVISLREMLNIDELLDSHSFKVLKHSTPPDFHVQQYYIAVRSRDVHQFFYLGLDDGTISLLRQMQQQLPSDAANGLQSIIDFLKQTK